MANRVPKVSVVLTTYNGSRYVREAIDGILNQTFGDFELIIIDDASTDDTVEIAKGYDDPRIRLIRNPENHGISATRNIGIDAARGAYLAAMDHDDISLPQRLERQIAFLDSRPETVLVGTSARLLEDGRLRDYYDPITEPHLLHWSLFTACCLIHSSICVRVEVLRRHGLYYRQQYHFAEDFDLYHRLAKLGDIACLPDRLTIYREHGGNASTRHRDLMTQHGQRFLLDVYREFVGPAVTPEDLNRVWTVLTRGRPAPSIAELRSVGELLARLLRRFLEQVTLSAAQAEDVRRAASQTWWRAVRRTAKQHGLHVLALYREFPDLVVAPRSLADMAQTVVAASVGPKLMGALAPHVKRLLPGIR